MNQQKSFANIVLIVLVVVLAGVVGYFALVKKFPEIAQETNTPTPTAIQTQTKTQNPTPKDKTTAWKSHSNTDIGFSFKYPQTWKVEDILTVSVCCLDLFTSINPYQGDFLKQNVMKAQFQYHVDASISNKQQYIDNLFKSSTEPEMGVPTNKSSVVSVQNENGLDIFKFSGGVGDIGYIIPRKANFSEVIYVIVWNPDSTLEKVLSTLKLTK